MSECPRLWIASLTCIKSKPTSWCPGQEQVEKQAYQIPGASCAAGPQNNKLVELGDGKYRQ